ncbi:hypothetical protein HRbin33_01909 [bacterium HR33]|nr:hypothetical protein HRbin33_01909 [bacterium HR33]
MPVRSLSSPVLKWPDAGTVDWAARTWAAELAGRNDAVVRVGYFGSYARGDWGPGSNLDLLIVVRDSPEPPHRRALAFDATDLPVPADVLVYTVREWQALESPPPGRKSIAPEAVWVYRESPADGS